MSDPAVPDDTEDGPAEVTDDGAAGRPLSGTDQGGEPAEALHQVHRHGHGTLGDRGGPGARRDHHGDPTGGGSVQVHPLDAHSGPGHDPQPRGAGQELGVHPGIRPDDGALRLRQVRLGRFRNEPAVPAEDRIHQGRVDEAEADHHRELGDLRHC